MEVPIRFFSDDDDGVKEVDPQNEQPQAYVQQSVYGMIAAAQRQSTALPGLYPASDSDGDYEAEEQELGRMYGIGDEKSSKRIESSERLHQSNTTRPSQHRQRSSLAENKPLPSFLTAAQRLREEVDDDHMSQSQVLPPRDKIVDAQVHSRRNTPQDLRSSANPMANQASGESGNTVSLPRPTDHLSLALAKIFQFQIPEDVVSEHPCCYLQSVLLQGYMYITQKHVCFYAYLPKKGHMLKSGHLGKQGRHTSRYRQFWFTLKGDVLSYFPSAAEPFFPKGAIDLRFATGADLAEPSQTDGTDVATFTITVNGRVHLFRAESSASAKEWVRQLQKVIFRSHNDGDSVKISMPIENIVDVEPNPILDFAKTVKIRVLDSEETYAVDEYFFTFFHNGERALRNLSALVERKDAMTSSQLMTLAVSDVVESSAMQHSAASVTTSDRTSDSMEHLNDGEDAMSASQILSGDAAFKSPTLRKSLAIRGTGNPTSRPSRPAPDERDIISTTVVNTHRYLANEVPVGQHAIGGHELYSQNSNDKLPASTPSSAGVTASGPPTRSTPTPLQQAYALAAVVRNQGKIVSSYLSSSPKTYYEKFSGAIVGGKRHYSDQGGLPLPDDLDDPELDMENAEHEQRFQQHFALPATEKLRAVYYCSLHRVLPLYGKIYISDRQFCFRSLLYGTRTKLVVPFKEIDNVTKEKGFRWSYPGMVLIIRGHEEVFFDFGSADVRDDCVVTILRNLDTSKATSDSVVLTEEERSNAGAAAAENDVLLNARHDRSGLYLDPAPEREAALRQLSPLLSKSSIASTATRSRPDKPLRITCLTVGSRGDVQPYIALCKGLMKDGHQVKIATHETFRKWIQSHGIEFAPVDGDPAELMRMCVENGMFTPSFMYEANSKFRGWLDDLLNSAWKACADSELLIESPPAMGGIHIAEALGIPYFRAFTMPWTRTRAYPHAFAAQGKRMGGQYNYTSYVIFEHVFWAAIVMQINRWRKKTLRLKATGYARLQANKVPFLYNFSPSVVPPPLDFSDWIKITGYWFLDEGQDWNPPSDLVAYIKKAKDDGMKLVYVGFGSVPVSDTKGLTQQIVDAVVKADVRCILSKGWSDHFNRNDPDRPNVALPPCVFEIRSAPHDWLFQQVDAAIHHGGAGTTGASLRAGLPTVVRPFFGDQFFFATRVEDLGVGIHLEKITVNALGKAIWLATHDERMRTKARRLGEKIRSEDGVDTAIRAIYRDLEYAQSLIKMRNPVASTSGDEDDNDAEESWTFVENETDLDNEDEYTGATAVPQQSTSSTRRPGLGMMTLRNWRD